MNKLKLFLIIITLSLLIVACGIKTEEDRSSLPITPDVVVNDTYPVDPLFSDFYEFLGGMDTLGPAITPLQESGNVKIQYLSSALMVYDSQTSEREGYLLASIGLYLGVAEPAVQNYSPTDVVVNGHIINPKFLSKFEAMGGEAIVGRPITEARYNLDYDRYEQYFENLGFFIKTGDLDEQIHLMAYGAFVCDHQCRFQAHQLSIPSIKPPLQEPFASTVANFGSSVVGKPLTDPYLSEDGKIEVIFENLVLIVDPEGYESVVDELPSNGDFLSDPTENMRIFRGEGESLNLQIWLPQVLFSIPGIDLDEERQITFHIALPIVVNFGREEVPVVQVRPIVELVGIKRRPNVQDNQDPLMDFYPIKEDFGHNVPQFFYSYIERLGGYEISGDPISEVYAVEGGEFRQCFENLCLDFDPKAPVERQLSLAPLGISYKDQYYDQREGVIQPQDNENIGIQVWETESFVSSKAKQEIQIVIKKDGLPIQASEPILIISLPDSSQIEYYFPATDEDGWSHLVLPPISAPTGTLIPYQVCLPDIEHEDICVSDNYLIWDHH